MGTTIPIGSRVSGGVSPAAPGGAEGGSGSGWFIRSGWWVGVAGLELVVDLADAFCAEVQIGAQPPDARRFAGRDPTVISQWIAETQATHARAEADLRNATHGTDSRMTRDEIARLVRSISDLAAVIRQADPEDKAEIYHQLGLRLTYTPWPPDHRGRDRPHPAIAGQRRIPTAPEKPWGFGSCPSTNCSLSPSSSSTTATALSPTTLTGRPRRRGRSLLLNLATPKGIDQRSNGFLPIHTNRHTDDHA